MSKPVLGAGAALVFRPAQERADGGAGREDDPEGAAEAEGRVRPGQLCMKAAQAGGPGDPGDGADQDEADAGRRLAPRADRGRRDVRAVPGRGPARVPGSANWS